MLSQDSQTIVVDTSLVGRYALLGPDNDRRRTFLAVDRRTQEHLSVELLPDEGFVVSTAVELRRRGLDHENLVQLFDVDIASDVPYVAMERIVGPTLGQCLTAAGGTLSLEECIPIMAQVLKGVGFVHANGFTLGEMTLERIVLCEHRGRENFVKLLPTWRAPHEYPTQNEDVEALGMLLMTLLAGTEAAAEPRWWRNTDSDVGRPLIELVEDCVLGPTEQRPSDANEFVGRLIRCVPAKLFRLRRTGETPAV